MNSQESRARAFLVALLAGIALAGLAGLDNPLFGPHHYRMNESAAMARNFYEHSMNIFYPRIDWGGAGPGFIEEAFQLYSFLVAVLYKLFGPLEPLGRALSLVAHVATAYLIFRVERPMSENRSALFAVFFFGASAMGIYYGRSFQPDSLILLCAVATVYLFRRFTEEGSRSALLASALTLSAAVLMKPHNLYLGLPLLYLCVRRFHTSLFRQPLLWAYAGIAVVPAAAWYAHAHQLWLEYGNTNGIWGQGFSMFGPTSQLIDLGIYTLSAKRVIFMITTLAGSALVVLGLLIRRRPGGYLPHFWLAGFAIAFLIAPQTGHDYYLMPLIAITALPMGAATSFLWQSRFEGLLLPAALAPRALVGLLCVVAAWQAFSAYRAYDVVPESQVLERRFAERLSALTEPGALVVVGLPSSVRVPVERQRHREPDGTYTALGSIALYQSHRKGWCVRSHYWSVELIDALRRKGATYFATWHVRGLLENVEFRDEMADRYELMEGTPEWQVYRLTP